MNTFEDCFKFTKKSFAELLEIYNNYSAKEKTIFNYPAELLTQRNTIVNWLIFLCNKFSFKLETFYRSITLFDLYVSKAFLNKQFSFYEIKLTSIACLSLATKLEEINCNFIQFFTENVLNSQNEEIYSKKDLVLKEIEILKVLNFKTNQSTSFQFLTVYQQICFNVLGDCEEFKQIVKLTNSTLDSFILNNQSVTYSPKYLALISFNQVISALSQIVYISPKFNAMSLKYILVTLYQIINKDKQQQNYQTKNINYAPNNFSCNNAGNIYFKGNISNIPNYNYLLYQNY